MNRTKKRKQKVKNTIFEAVATMDLNLNQE